MIGRTLGHYEINELVGQGGMGEVYRARDTRLGRTVAIKVLPSHLSERAEVRERFEREARMISSLSHPHVCALYDIGHDQDVDFLVMEYLEGTTLADRIDARGALPFEDALRIGMQTADALAAAHRLGIVHRDLKPGNIMLTATGVKLLDFGLAKAAESRPESEPGVTALQTEAAERPLTQEGTILGTLQYMAPEQLEGKDTDARTDIFALGLVLYEMVSGKRAFHGDSQASLIAAIMSTEPTSMATLIPMTPPALERLVGACLSKDPEARVQSAHDVRLQLEWIVQSGGEATAVASPAAEKRPSRLGWAVAAVLAIVAGALALQRAFEAETSAPTTRLSVVPPSGLRMTAEPVDIAVAPDGRSIAFLATDSVGTRSLWVRDLGALQPERVPGGDAGFAPFWSPDSRNLGFFRDGKMMRVALFGSGATQVICDATSGRGATWSDDNIIVFAPTSSGPLYSVSASGGTPQQVTVLDESAGETAHRYPEFLPGGRDFIYVAIATAGVQTRLASLDGSEPVTLVTGGGMATYAEPGYLIYEEAPSLLAMRFDPKQRRVTGDPFALVDRAGGSRDYMGSMAVRVARNGTMVLIQSEPTSQLTWFDRSGRAVETLPLPADAYDFPAICPDGRRAVVRRVHPQNVYDLWLLEFGRNALTRLTFEPRENSGARWSRDGRILAFSSLRDGTRNIYVKRGGGTGPTELFVRMEGTFALPLDWAPDGRSMLIRQLRADTDNDLLIYTLDDQKLAPFIETRFSEREASISLDGKWVAYRSNETGQEELFVQPFPGLGSKTQISMGGTRDATTSRSSRILWGPDGDEIVYLGPDARTLIRVPIETTPALRVGQGEPLFRLPEGCTWFDSIDNQRFLLSVRANEIQQLTVVTNWAAELEAR